MVRDAGFERITAFALLSAATNFSGVEMSGFGAPARTARPIRLRPSGVNVPGITPPSSDSVVISWNGSTMTSGGGVLFVISSTMVPMPTVMMPTVFFRFLRKRGSDVGQAGGEHHTWGEDSDICRRIIAGGRRSRRRYLTANLRADEPGRHQRDCESGQ